MKRIFLFLLLIVISNKAIASLESETLICDKDTRGYNFISKDKVKVSGINLNKLKIFSINHSYEINENAIFIQQPLKALDNKEKPRPIGWIFRRTLDYVSLDYINGDWSRKFLWSCEVTSLNLLEIRLKKTFDELINARKK